MFNREKFEKKGIVKDVTSISGNVDKSAKNLVIGDVLAYDPTKKKWNKYVKATHDTGAFLLGIVKNDVDVTAADKTIAILTQGQVYKKDVAEATDENLFVLLAKQGIYLV